MMRFGKIDPHSLSTKTMIGVGRLVTGEASGCSVRLMRGKLEETGLIYFGRNGKQCFRQYVKPRQPDSLDQQIHSLWFSRAERHWLTIFDEHAENWALYAERHQAILKYGDLRMNNGRHLMREVAPPVNSRLEVFQNPVQETDTFSFQVMHNIPNPAGMHLLVEISPATLRPTRKPHPKSYRPIRGKNAGSYVALQESDATYTVTGARFAVADGERYGMRLRIIDTEFISGDFVTADFVHEVQAGPAVPVAEIMHTTEAQRHGEVRPTAVAIPGAEVPGWSLGGDSGQSVQSRAGP
jgi:hypothetical protein